jgi:hypothetical protein
VVEPAVDPAMVVAVVAHPAEAIEKEEDTGKFFFISSKDIS